MTVDWTNNDTSSTPNHNDQSGEIRKAEISRITAEADKISADAERVRADAEQARANADKARADADFTRSTANVNNAEAEKILAEAEKTRAEAHLIEAKAIREKAAAWKEVSAARAILNVVQESPAIKIIEQVKLIEQSLESISSPPAESLTEGTDIPNPEHKSDAEK